MAQPVISSATFDKDSYVAGDTALLTVVRGDETTTSETDAVTVSATDNVTGESSTFSATLTISDVTKDPTTVGATSATGRTFTIVSDDTVTAVLSTIV